MDLAGLIGTYGYAALSLGCLLEGETVLLLAGLAAHRGYLDPFAVVAVAAASGFAGDQFWYWLGRRHGAAVLARFPAMQRHSRRIGGWIARYHGWVVVGVRFAYGLRLAGPVLIGASGLPPARFAAFNAIGAALWACAIGGIGWLFGEAAQALLGNLARVEEWLFGALAAAGVAAWLIGRARARARRRADVMK